MRKRNFLLVVAFLLIGGVVHASDEQPMGGYSIEGVQNVHQIDKNAGYFDLYEQPSEEDQIKVKLMNDSSQEKHLSVKVTDGNTNINGEVDYTGSLKNNPKLTQPLTSVLKVEQSEVTVPAHSSVETNLNLKMPMLSFPGIILGGIVVSDAQASPQHSGVMTNTYSYTLGVVLTNDEKGIMKKNISVQLDKVGAKLFEGKKVVEASILNDHPFIFSADKVSGKIKEKKSGKVIQEVSKDKVSIAPYSAFPLQFDWKKADLKAGDYIFTGLVQDSKKSWKLEKDFTITHQQTKEINSQSVFKVVIPLWLKILEFVSFIFSSIGVFYNVKQLRKRKK